MYDQRLNAQQVQDSFIKYIKRNFFQLFRLIIIISVLLKVFFRSETGYSNFSALIA